MKMKFYTLCLAWVVFFSVPARLWCQLADESFITLNNYDSNSPIFYWSGFGPLTRAAVAGTYAQILARPVARGEFQVLSSTTGASIFTLQDPGFFDGGMGSVPGVERGGLAEVYIRAWRGADSWDNALQSQFAYVGRSEVFINLTQYWSGAGQPVPAPLFNALPFTMIQVPEPSIFALGLLGAIMVGLRRHCLRR